MFIFFVHRLSVGDMYDGMVRCWAQRTDSAYVVLYFFFIT